MSPLNSLPRNDIRCIGPGPHVTHANIASVSGVFCHSASSSWAAKDPLGRERALWDHDLSPTSVRLKLEGSETRLVPQPCSTPTPTQPPCADPPYNPCCQLSLATHRALLSGQRGDDHPQDLQSLSLTDGDLSCPLPFLPALQEDSSLPPSPTLLHLSCLSGAQ